MIESLPHFSVEDAVEHGEVNDESREWIDLALYRYFARIRMTVKARARAGAENFLVFLVAPLRTSITVCSCESDAPCQIGGWHAGKVLLATRYPLPAAESVLRVDPEISFVAAQSLGGWTLGRNPWLGFFDRLTYIVGRARIQITVRHDMLGLRILLTRLVA